MEISTTLMEAIVEATVDRQRDEAKALQHQDNYVQTKNGRHHVRKTTKGWELLIKWKDKSEFLIQLADMKESHPVEVAEYERARGIDKEPALNGGSNSEEEASYISSTQEEDQKDNTQVWY